MQMLRIPVANLMACCCCHEARQSAGAQVAGAPGLAEDQADTLVGALQHLEQVIVTGESLCRY